jgi:hypothetical protein
LEHLHVLFKAATSQVGSKLRLLFRDDLLLVLKMLSLSKFLIITIITVKAKKELEEYHPLVPLEHREIQSQNAFYLSVVSPESDPQSLGLYK